MEISWEDAAQKAGMIIGVPDSTLAPWIEAVEKTKQFHVSPSEGAALACAAMFGGVSGKVPIVYLQNSGLGNVVNPYMSFSHPKVYSLPVLFVVGWRGWPQGSPDEPQHNTMGGVTPSLMHALGIGVLYECSREDSFTPSLLAAALDEVAHSGTSGAILVTSKEACQKRDVIRHFDLEANHEKVMQHGQKFESAQSTKSEFIQAIFEFAPENSLVIASTGHIAREALIVASARNEEDRLFMVTGAMGHASAITYGAAKADPQTTFVCMDGDGSAVMHLASTFDLAKVHNVKYFLMNNGAHASVGGQPTSLGRQHLHPVFQALFGHDKVSCSLKAQEISSVFERGTLYNEVIIDNSTSPALPRPSQSHIEMKRNFLSRFGGPRQ